MMRAIMATMLQMPNPGNNPLIAMQSYSEGFNLGHQSSKGARTSRTFS